MNIPDKTGSDSGYTAEVKRDPTSKKLYVPAGGSGGGSTEWKLIDHYVPQEDSIPSKTAWTQFQDGTKLHGIKQLLIKGMIKGATGNTVEGYMEICINGERLPGIKYGAQKELNYRYLAVLIDFDLISKINAVVQNNKSVPPLGANMIISMYSFFNFDATENEIESIGMNFPTGGAVGYGVGTDLYLYAR